MGPTEITDLLPLGGASALLVYLLRIIQVERQRWVDERATLIEEHRARTDAANKHWQERYELVVSDNDALRARETLREQKGQL